MMRLSLIALFMLGAVAASAQQKPARPQSHSAPSKLDGIPLEVRTAPVPATPIDTFQGRPVYAYAEQQPEYPGGLDQMLAFLRQQLRYPPQHARTTVEGRVFVSFIVDQDGQVQRPAVIQGLAEYCDAEALRVVRRLAQFTPGYRAGQPVAVPYVVALRFDGYRGWNAGPRSNGRRR